VAGSAASKTSSPAHLTKKPTARHWRCRYIAGVEIEGDLQPEDSVSNQGDQRGQQAAGNGVGNVPAAQRRDTAIEAGAAEEQTMEIVKVNKSGASKKVFAACPFQRIDHWDIRLNSEASLQ
jgi:hypothetical protein